MAGTPSTTLTWSYDPFGNRKQRGPSGGTSSYPPGNNRISGFSYEASGNVKDDGSNQYVYDGEGRLCTVYNKTMTSYTAYAYDGLGNRVAKGGGNGLSCDNNLTATSTFIVGPNGEQLDALSASGAVYSNVFAHGQLLATYQFPSSSWTYALNDWLGTKRFVAKADGSQAEICTGLPFGDGLNCTGTSDPSSQHFTGKERDSESGNDYFGARYYASSMGRLMTPDPGTPTPLHLLNPQRWNMYSYGLNNPFSYTDSTGMDAAAVNFSKEIAIVGHQGIMSVHSDGTVVYARFGPVGGNRPTGPGQVQSFTLKTKVQFDSNELPTADSLNAVKEELGKSGPEKGQDPSSIRLNYFKTTPQETANLDQWIQQQQDASNRGQSHGYDVTSTNCTWFCARGLVAAGVLDQNQANHASPAPNGFWWQLGELQSRQPCARTEAYDDKGNSTGWSGCQ